jgi:hypothetical protein
MVSVKDEENIHRTCKHRVDGVVVTDAEHHVQEVLGVRHRVVRQHERQALAEAVTHCGDGRHFGDEAQHLLIEGLFVENVLCIIVKSAKCCGGRHEHPHGVGVVVETVDEPFAHVLVNHGVVRDVVCPFGHLIAGGQLAVQEQIRNFEKCGVLGKLLDRVAAISQDACITIEVCDGGRARCGREKRRVIQEQIRVELSKCRRGEGAAGDGDRDFLAGPVVDDGDGVSHWDLLVTDLMFGGFLPRRNRRQIVVSVPYPSAIAELIVGAGGLFLECVRGECCRVCERPGVLAFHAACEERRTIHVAFPRVSRQRRHSRALPRCTG